MPAAPPLSIAPEPRFDGVAVHALEASVVVGDMTLPVLVGDTALFLHQAGGEATLCRWDGCRGELVELLSHRGSVRCSLSDQGLAVMVLLDGHAWDVGLSLRPLAGRIVLAALDGRITELATKAAGDRCPGGDGLGHRWDCAAFDDDGTVVVDLPGRAAVFSPDGRRLAERPPPAPGSLLAGWHRHHVVWDEEGAEGGRRVHVWDPSSGKLRTRRPIAWRAASASGGWLEGARGRRSRVLAWRAPDGTRHRHTLPAPYGFRQWFAGDAILCHDAELPSLVVDATTGAARPCFPDRLDVGVLAASATRPILLGSHDGKLAVARADEPR